MNDSLIIQLALRMSMVVTIAFLLTRVKPFRRLLYNTASVRERLILTVVFSAIAIFGTISAVEIQGALANSRVIGAVMAGLLGGPLMGAGAGFISGLHRWYLGGFTGFACGLSTFTEGLVAGLIHKICRDKKIGWETAFLTGIITESMQMLIILLVARPFPAALNLVKAISVPMIAVNSLGIAIFMMIVRNAQEEEERIGAVQAQKVLSIANKTLQHLRQGLNRESAQNVAEVIKQSVNVEAVAITDDQKILAHVGGGSDHHLPGQFIMTRATRWVLEHGTIMVAANKDEIQCSHPRCTLRSAVIIPLFSGEKKAGALKLYQAKENSVSSLDLEFAKGLGLLFSTQLELAELEAQGKLLKEAQLKALQAQINPHFLFNSLNTIVSFSRHDPEKTRELLIHLGDFFRKTLSRNQDFITIAEELERIDAYLAIEQARNGARLQVLRDIDPGLLEVAVPALILQPLVENCVKHGILPKPRGGAVFIKVARDGDRAVITVEDNGVGMDAAGSKKSKDVLFSGKGAGIGLKNVDQRLKTIYGQENGLKITSGKGVGTRFEIAVPIHYNVRAVV
ncbi:MAG: sensor histidine kinase [Peptococcaceae bacterium]|nr:sensor histidine kinase [Peptococcaceae bacterium]